MCFSWRNSLEGDRHVLLLHINNYLPRAEDDFHEVLFTIQLVYNVNQKLVIY